MQSKIYQTLKKISPESDFLGSTDFVEDGILDSLCIVELMVALEKEFGIKIKGIDVLQENFNSVEHISKILKKYGVLIDNP